MKKIILIFTFAFCLLPAVYSSGSLHWTGTLDTGWISLTTMFAEKKADTIAYMYSTLADGSYIQWYKVDIYLKDTATIKVAFNSAKTEFSYYWKSGPNWVGWYHSSSQTDIWFKDLYSVAGVEVSITVWW